LEDSQISIIEDALSKYGIDRSAAVLLEALRAACSAVEWEHGGSKIGSLPVAGVFIDSQLIAVAGYKVWGDVIAHISVVVHPDYRNRGQGKAVVSQVTGEMFNRGLVPQYQTLEANLSSMAVGRALGFERYATTVAVRLRNDST
jgi:ribosomal protein S18 acetylase RimI-like enzyme